MQGEALLREHKLADTHVRSGGWPPDSMRCVLPPVPFKNACSHEHLVDDDHHYNKVVYKEDSWARKVIIGNTHRVSECGEKAGKSL